MAIQETKRKINFIPFTVKKGRDKDTSPAPTMTLNQGKLRFSKSLITELDLNGKFVRFFYEPSRNIVGFRVEEQINQEVMKDWKMVRQSSNGNWTVTITKILAFFHRGLESKSFEKMPVKKYVEMTSMLDRGETFYYVVLSNEANEDEE